MGSDWQIEDWCPQCGAPVTLDETDRLLSCAYCQVRLYVATAGVPRYCLPVKPAPVGEVVMVPYWRFRAAHYRCVPWEVRSSVLDSTRLATPAPGLSATLGVRAQAVRLRFAAATLGSRFLPPAGPPPWVEDHVAATAVASAGEDSPLFEASVGIATSIVYAPVRLTRAVFDAVLNRRLGACADEWLRATSPGSDAPPPIRFLATLCPACGWQLEGGRDSLVLLCVNCRAGWRANGAGLREVPYEIAETCESRPGPSPLATRLAQGGHDKSLRRATRDDRPALLPFWRVAARVTGLSLGSWADLVRFANLPKVVRAEWEEEPLRFWIPAFKTNPGEFLRLAQDVTLARPGCRDGGIGAALARRSDPSAPSLRNCLAVTLDDDALPAAVKVLAANLGLPKTRVFPRLRDVSVEVSGSDLVYLDPASDAPRGS